MFTVNWFRNFNSYNVGMLRWPLSLFYGFSAINGWVFLIWKINGPFIVGWMDIGVILLFWMFIWWMEVVRDEMDGKWIEKEKSRKTGFFVAGACTQSTCLWWGRLVALKMGRNQSQLTFWKNLQIQCAWLTEPCTRSASDTKNTGNIGPSYFSKKFCRASVCGRSALYPVDQIHWETQGMRFCLDVDRCRWACVLHRSVGHPVDQIHWKTP